MIEDRVPNDNYKFILKSLDVEHFRQDFIDIIKNIFWKHFDDNNSINDDLVLMWNGHKVDLIPDYNYEHFKDREHSKDYFEDLKKNAIERCLPNIPKNKRNHQRINSWRRNVIGSNIKLRDIENEIEISLRRNLQKTNFRFKSKIKVDYYRINDAGLSIRNYLAIWYGKRILAVVCERIYVRHVYSQIFMFHMTRKETEDYQTRLQEEYEPFDKYTEEDAFRDGFDGDIDAWNHYNQ